MKTFSVCILLKHSFQHLIFFLCVITKQKLQKLKTRTSSSPHLGMILTPLHCTVSLWMACGLVLHVHIKHQGISSDIYIRGRLWIHSIGSGGWRRLVALATILHAVMEIGDWVVIAIVKRRLIQFYACLQKKTTKWRIV